MPQCGAVSRSASSAHGMFSSEDVLTVRCARLCRRSNRSETETLPLLSTLTPWPQDYASQLGPRDIGSRSADTGILDIALNRREVSAAEPAWKRPSSRLSHPHASMAFVRTAQT
jgi:hypothetical protein